MRMLNFLAMLLMLPIVLLYTVALPRLAEAVDFVFLSIGKAIDLAERYWRGKLPR